MKAMLMLNCTNLIIRMLHPVLDIGFVSVAKGVASWCVGGQDEKVSDSVNHISSAGTSCQYHWLCCGCGCACTSGWLCLC